jgi:hypothetical protein
MLRICVVLVALVACDEQPTGGPPTSSRAPVAPPAVVAPPPAAPPAVHEAPPLEARIIEVSAKQLYADYDANEVSADDKYKGKTLRVSGMIETIGKDILGAPFVEFTTRYGLGVQCMFDDSDKPALAAPKKGQKLVALGTGDGKLGNVILRRCVIEMSSNGCRSSRLRTSSTTASVPELLGAWKHEVAPMRRFFSPHRPPR